MLCLSARWRASDRCTTHHKLQPEPRGVKTTIARASAHTRRQIRPTPRCAPVNQDYNRDEAVLPAFGPAHCPPKAAALLALPVRTCGRCRRRSWRRRRNHSLEDWAAYWPRGRSNGGLWRLRGGAWFVCHICYLGRLNDTNVTRRRMPMKKHIPPRAFKTLVAAAQPLWAKVW